MRILIVSDAWHPQINGVVTTLSKVVDELESQNHTVHVIHPGLFFNVPMPMYREIRLAVTLNSLGKDIEAFAPDAIHIATEGPLGWKARHYCLKHQIAFTTSLHTRFPEYIHERLPFVSINLGYEILKRFHGKAQSTLVTTHSLRDELSGRGFEHLKVWTRGVDHRIFNPDQRRDLGYKKPVMLYVGRIAPEKNLTAFLDCPLPGTKVLVGDGPARVELEAQYPEAHFLGVKKGEDLAKVYASSDVFVFPSKTDTFGVVMLEAMACGVPVAAYPVTGPIDIVNQGVSGALHDDLTQAIDQALTVDRGEVCFEAQKYTWQSCADLFYAHLVPIKAPLAPSGFDPAEESPSD